MSTPPTMNDDFHDYSYADLVRLLGDADQRPLSALLTDRKISHNDVSTLPGYRDGHYRDNLRLVFNKCIGRDWHEGEFEEIDRRDNGILTKCVCSQDIKYVHILLHKSSGLKFEIGTDCAGHLVDEEEMKTIYGERKKMETLRTQPDAKFCQHEGCYAKLRKARVASGLCKTHSPTPRRCGICGKGGLRKGRDRHDSCRLKLFGKCSTCKLFGDRCKCTECIECGKNFKTTEPAAFCQPCVIKMEREARARNSKCCADCSRPLDNGEPPHWSRCRRCFNVYKVTCRRRS